MGRVKLPPELPMEVELKLVAVFRQSEQLNEEELRLALQVAWARWLTERFAIRQVLEGLGITLQLTGEDDETPFALLGRES